MMSGFIKKIHVEVLCGFQFFLFVLLTKLVSAGCPVRKQRSRQCKITLDLLHHPGLDLFPFSYGLNRSSRDVAWFADR